MTDSPLIPGSHSRPIAPTGQFAGEWYRFFRDLIRYVQETEGNTAELAALEARVAALEAAGQNPLTLLGPFSVQVLGSLLDGSATVQLVNDEGNPGAWRFYATDESGGKAWLPLYPDAVPNPYADYILDPDGNYVTDPDGNFLMSQDGFPIPLEYGGTGADNSTVAANLVWASPDGMAGAPVFRALVGDDLPVPLPDLVAGGTTGQFWRGDGAWANLLAGPLTVSHNPGSGQLALFERTLGGETDVAVVSGGGSASGLSTDGDMVFRVGALDFSGGIEAGRFKLDGSLGIGTTNPNPFGAGVKVLKVSSAALSMISVESSFVSPSVVMEMNAEGAPRGLIGTRSNHALTLKTNNVPRAEFSATGDFYPGADNTHSNGTAVMRWSNTFTYNLTVGQNAPSLGGGAGVLFIANAATVPTSNPTGGGILYVSGGALFYRGSSGTVTPLAPA